MWADIVQANMSVAARPEMMRGAVGKVLGQFGVYPITMLGLANRVVQNGKPADKAWRIGRWAAANYAIQEAYAGVGMDYSRYLWFHPAIYTYGGPWASNVTDIMQGIDMGRTEEVQKDALRFGKMLVPGYYAGRDITAAAGAAGKGDLGEAFRRLVAVPALKEKK